MSVIRAFDKAASAGAQFVARDELVFVANLVGVSANLRAELNRWRDDLRAAVLGAHHAIERARATSGDLRAPGPTRVAAHDRLLTDVKAENDRCTDSERSK